MTAAAVVIEELNAKVESLTALLAADRKKMEHMVWRSTYAAVVAQRDALEKALREIAPAARDILWCAVCWNDHNFGYVDLLAKAGRAAESFGIDRYDFDAMNAWLERVDALIPATSKTSSEPK